MVTFFCRVIARYLYREDFYLLKSSLYKACGTITKEDILSCNHKLVQLLIVGEDHRFNLHVGFDPIGILRAIKVYFFDKRLQGASTIEQQLVRVLIDDYRLSISRKIKEIILAVSLKTFIPRNHLPVVYLHVAYFGNNVFGLPSLLNIEFNNCPVQMLSVERCAEIIARIKYPASSADNILQKARIDLRKRHLMMKLEQNKDLKFALIYNV